MRCPTGEARITPGFDLPARWVIHTVGPVWEDGEADEDTLLASCYRNVFALCRKHDIKTIALPAISCGVFRFPLHRATAIALRESCAVLATAPLRITFCAYSEEVARAYRDALSR